MTSPETPAPVTPATPGTVTATHTATTRTSTAAPAPSDATVTTRHTLRTASGELPYTATTGRIVLRDQGIIAGIGNAYSDEILHVAKMSPFAIAASLDEEAVSRLYAAMRSTLAAAVATASGKPAAELKDAKRAGMRVHGRTGEVCPECGDVVREVSFADSSLQYCATCQTGGKPLADRRTSKFLK